MGMRGRLDAAARLAWHDPMSAASEGPGARTAPLGLAGLAEVDHADARVRDEARAAAPRSHAGVIGFRRVAELAFRGLDGGPLTRTDAGGRVHSALFQRRAGMRHATVALGTDAEGLLARRRHLAEARGEPPAIEDHGRSWSPCFRDPGRNPFEITSHDHRAIAPRLGEGA